jgi:hypothetical protein
LTDLNIDARVGRGDSLRSALDICTPRRLCAGFFNQDIQANLPFSDFPPAAADDQASSRVFGERAGA